MSDIESLSMRFDLLLENQKGNHDVMLKNVLDNVYMVKYSEGELIEFYPYEHESFGLSKGNEIINKNHSYNNVKKITSMLIMM